MIVQMSPRTTADFPSTTSLALMFTNLIWGDKLYLTKYRWRQHNVFLMADRTCHSLGDKSKQSASIMSPNFLQQYNISVCQTYPLATEELQCRVDVAQVMRPSEDSTSLHGKSLPRENLQKSQQLHSITEILDQVVNLHRWLPLAQIGVDPVDECLALNSFLLI